MSRQGQGVSVFRPFGNADDSVAADFVNGKIGRVAREIRRIFAASPEFRYNVLLGPRTSGTPMLAKLNTFALVGIDAVPVEVEVDASAGLPKTVLVGRITPI
jgi:Ni,Fe-hydrogenase III small subunit